MPWGGGHKEGAAPCWDPFHPQPHIGRCRRLLLRVERANAVVVMPQCPPKAPAHSLCYHLSGTATSQHSNPTEEKASPETKTQLKDLLKKGICLPVLGQDRWTGRSCNQLHHQLHDSYLHQVFIDPFSEGFLLDSVPFICQKKTKAALGQCSSCRNSK